MHDGALPLEADLRVSDLVAFCEANEPSQTAERLEMDDWNVRAGKRAGAFFDVATALFPNQS